MSAAARAIETIGIVSNSALSSLLTARSRLHPQKTCGASNGGSFYGDAVGVGAAQVRGAIVATTGRERFPVASNQVPIRRLFVPSDILPFGHLDSSRERDVASRAAAPDADFAAAPTTSTNQDVARLTAGPPCFIRRKGHHDGLCNYCNIHFER
jgi:hypothetical protein